MNGTVMKAEGRRIVTLPRGEWEKGLARAPENCKVRLAFMSAQHHQVRDFVVKEMPVLGKPIPPEWISERLDLPVKRVKVILDELEKALFFLVRNENGAVSWAFPVTADRTAHRLSFSSGERLYGA